MGKFNVYGLMDYAIRSLVVQPALSYLQMMNANLISVDVWLIWLMAMVQDALLEQPIALI